MHREYVLHPPGDLRRALADLAAELYQVPAERLWAHASRRAEAMTIRDHAARREVGVLEDDWDRIEAVLWVAWKALADEVQGPPPRGPGGLTARPAATTATPLQARSPATNSSRETTAITAATGAVTVEPSSSRRAASRTRPRPGRPAAGGR